MEKSMKRIVLAVLAVIGLFVLTACGAASKSDGAKKANKDAASENKKDAEEPVKLTIGYLNVMDDAQVMLAEDAGIFEKYGLYKLN